MSAVQVRWSWFKLGFPSGYVTDLLQNLEALCEVGAAGSPRVRNAVQWLLSKHDDQAVAGLDWIKMFAPYLGQAAL